MELPAKNQRVKILIDMYSGGSVRKFSQEIGLYSQKLNRLFHIDKKSGIFPPPSDDIFSAIANKYSTLNFKWLYKGEDPMFNPNPDEPGQCGFPGKSDPYSVPLLPISAQGGRLDEFFVSVKDTDCERVVSPIKNADFAITVSGDSMAPEYPSGSQILIKKIDERAFIDWGKVFVLDTCNGTILKRIGKSAKEGCITCYSLNPDPIYDPYDICMTDIFGMYRVMMCMAVK